MDRCSENEVRKLVVTEWKGNVSIDDEWSHDVDEDAASDRL